MSLRSRIAGSPAGFRLTTTMVFVSVSPSQSRRCSTTKSRRHCAPRSSASSRPPAVYAGSSNRVLFCILKARSSQEDGLFSFSIFIFCFYLFSTPSYSKLRHSILGRLRIRLHGSCRWCLCGGCLGLILMHHIHDVCHGDRGHASYLPVLHKL